MVRNRSRTWPGLHRTLALAYRLSARTPAPEEPVEVSPDLVVPRFVVEWSERAPEDARRLANRLLRDIDVAGLDVLVVGRGAVDLAIEVALRRARRVVAVDMAPRLMALSGRRLAGRHSGLPVEMVGFDGALPTWCHDAFDAVLAADALRSYGARRGSRHVEELTRQLACCLRPGGTLAMRFGPSWKAPYGGGVDSRLPWAHLLFPEGVIFDEFRRARPGSRAAAFEDIGVNRITLRRYRRAMEATGLPCLRFETNATDRRALRPLLAGARLPGLAEFLTQNAYGIWRRPPARGATDVVSTSKGASPDARATVGQVAESLSGQVPP